MKKLRKFLLQINSKFDLDEYKGSRNLHLGCGNKPLKNFLNLDYYNTKYIDEKVDLNKPLPYENNSFNLIYSDNVFEHIENLIDLIKECYRILKKDGHLIIKVPYFKSKHAFVDPTHKIYFTIQSMDYFVKGTYFNKEYRFIKESFETLYIYLDDGQNSVLFKKIIAIFASNRPNYFENSIWSNLFVFHNITYIMRK
ncbi:methyltransferase domain-containing protein [Candidatus Neomarinimicrobiota bacterium]